MNVYSTLGAVLELMASSKLHQNYLLKGLIEKQIFPAMKHKQIKIYFSEQKTPVALVVWAWLSKERLDDLCLLEKQSRGLAFNEWNCGSILFFNDFIAPYGNAKKIFNDVINNVFPDEDLAISLRRNKDGSIRKKNIWRRKSGEL